MIRDDGDEPKHVLSIININVFIYLFIYHYISAW